jgi:hypothetical protein
VPIPGTERSKATMRDRSLSRDAISNPAGDMDVCLLWVLCVVRPLPRAHHSSRGVIQTVHVIVCDLETSRMRRRWPALGWCGTEKKSNQCKLFMICFPKRRNKANYTVWKCIIHHRFHKHHEEPKTHTICLFVSNHIYIYIYIYICVCVCIYIYIYIYIYIHRYATK